MVILVDMKDNAIGTMAKMEAHEKGLMHRAFSVFLFNEDKLLLQKRASHKYHCGGLWTNTCCSHPRPGEAVRDAAVRRLREELGISTDEVEEIGSFAYRAEFANGITEFEYDHVLVGEYSGDFVMNPEEVDDVQWVDVNVVLDDLAVNPEKYTPWFITALAKVVSMK